MADPRDKRLFRRTPDQFMVSYIVKSPFEVYVQLNGRECDATAYDISEGGLALATNYDIPMKAVIVLRFTLFTPAGLRKFQIESEVRYAEPVPSDRSFRLGVRFTSLTPADRAAIVEYVRSQGKA